MRYSDDQPLYFRMPQNLKRDFEHICKADRMTMTQTLNTFIKGFVAAKFDEDPQMYDRNYHRPKQWSILKR